MRSSKTGSVSLQESTRDRGEDGRKRAITKRAQRPNEQRKDKCEASVVGSGYRSWAYLPRLAGGWLLSASTLQAELETQGLFSPSCAASQEKEERASAMWCVRARVCVCVCVCARVWVCISLWLPSVCTNLDFLGQAISLVPELFHCLQLFHIAVVSEDLRRLGLGGGQKGHVHAYTHTHTHTHGRTRHTPATYITTRHTPHTPHTPHTRHIHHDNQTQRTVASMSALTLRLAMFCRCFSRSAFHPLKLSCGRMDVLVAAAVCVAACAAALVEDSNLLVISSISPATRAN